jgi:HK97 family phage prohead protease
MDIEKSEYRRKDFNFDIKSKQFDNSDEVNYYTFSGLASTFGNIDEDNEIIMPGAFSKTIKEWRKSGRDVPMLWQHDRTNPIGIFKNLIETDIGLEVTGHFPVKRKDRFVEDKVIPQLGIGSVRTMSIGFNVEKWFVNEARDNVELHEIKLVEVSLVTTPANPLAVITSLKAANLTKYKVRDLEKILTKDGAIFSHKIAKKVISILKNQGIRDDAVNNVRDVIVDDLTEEKKEIILQKLNEMDKILEVNK